GIPPRQHRRRDELRAARAEGQRIYGELGAPDRRDSEQGREHQEEVLQDHEPQGARREEEVPERVLQARDPRQRRDQHVRQLTPRFGYLLDQLKHSPLLVSKRGGTSIYR